MAQITISKSAIDKQKGVVILPLKQYRDLVRGAAPTYYLSGKDLSDVLKAEQTATTMALRQMRRPVITLTVPELSANVMGQLA